jgi:hypothetical protein
MHPLQMITCNCTGCTTQIHHARQSQWKFKFDAEPTEMMKVCRAHHLHYASHTAAITAAAKKAAPNLPTFGISTPNLNLPASEVSFLNAANPLPDNSPLTGQLPMPLLPPLIGFNDDILDPNAAITTAAITTTLAATAAVETAAIATNANTMQAKPYSNDEESFDEDFTAGDDSEEEGDEADCSSIRKSMMKIS